MLLESVVVGQDLQLKAVYSQVEHKLEQGSHI